ncbi:MAG: hypothetical protein SVS15_02750 [Thermodesulfobacteriota bacterium]|nr:hypothetical protein [Thermodesulfobacteriota bacterium]
MTRIEEISSFKESPDSWQIKVHNFFRLPFPLPWMVIAGVLFLIGYGIVFHYENNNIDSIQFVALESVLIFAIANAVIFFEGLMDDMADTLHELLDEEEEEVKKWICLWYDNIFWSKKNIFVGVGLGCLIGVTSAEVLTSTPGKIYVYLSNFIIGFLGGSMLWAMLGIARLMLSLGRDVKIKLSIFDTAASPLRAASIILLKISLSAVLVYIIGISICFLCELELKIVNVIIIYFFGLFIVLYFIIPQINIHKTLVRIKQNRIKKLVVQIEDVFDNVATNPTDQNINKLRELFHLQKVVNGKKSWSFGIGELLILVGSIIIPLTIFIITNFL